LPLRIKLDLRPRHHDARQAEVVACGEVEVFVNLIDLLA
jgi:hypothetical protein